VSEEAHKLKSDINLNIFPYWYQIFDFLDFVDLLNIAPTNKLFHREVAKPDLLLKFKKYEPVRLSYELKRAENAAHPPDEIPTIKHETFFALDSMRMSFEGTPGFMSPRTLASVRASIDQVRKSMSLRDSKIRASIKAPSVADSMELLSFKFPDLSSGKDQPAPEHIGAPNFFNRGGVIESAHFKSVETLSNEPSILLTD
jgi:hypothetical protein